MQTPLSIAPELDKLKHWTVTDYLRMGDLGIIPADERTELIAGQVVVMAAKGTPHVLALRLLARRLDGLVDQVSTETLPYFVSTQDPIQLDQFSQPEPDLAIVQGTIWDYCDRHPSGAEVALVVEVADSTLQHDCNVKDKLYAQAGIADYWVLDLKQRCFHIFRQPTPRGYASHLILTPPNQIAPLAFPEQLLALAEFLPPVE